MNEVAAATIGFSAALAVSVARSEAVRTAAGVYFVGLSLGAWWHGHQSLANLACWFTGILPDEFDVSEVELFDAIHRWWVPEHEAAQLAIMVSNEGMIVVG